MADYPISNVPRRIVYTGSAGVGPYAFNFEVLVNTDINVYKNDTLLTLTTDYTVSINSTLGTGSVTLVSAASGSDRITIVGSRAIERSSDFTTGGDFFANTLNDEMDSQTILVQQVAETAERSLKAPVTDPTSINMTLPKNTTRANKFLSFDANGNPQALDALGAYRGDWTTATAYNLQDIVKDSSNDNIYLCVSAHTSTGTTPLSTNADIAKWSLIVDAESASDSAAAAAASETAAAASASSASTSASNASTSATNAATSASTATSQASAAASSASTASTAATNAGNSATAAATSASNASTSASAASTSATNAASSASSASSSASTASTKASEASTSASNAANSANSASSSATSAATSATNASSSASSAATSASTASTAATNAANSYDAFDDRYLGAKSSAPAVDNDGNALLTGALYWDTTNTQLYVWTGSAWNAAAFSASGAVTSFNTRTGAITLTSGDVTGALTYTPASSGTNTFTSNQIISVTDNTNAALRVTQLGTGDALLVEDSANPDSSPFVVKNDGKVGIGTANPTYNLEVYGSEPTARIWNTNAGYAGMLQISNPSNYMLIGKDRDGSAGWYGNAGEYIIACNGAFPLDFHTNGTKRLSITASGGVSFGSTGTAYGTTGQVLTSNGNAPPTWATASGAVADGVIYENGTTISSSYTFTTGKNGMSVGPITIASGATVTIPSGQRWVVL